MSERFCLNKLGWLIFLCGAATCAIDQSFWKNPRNLGGVKSALVARFPHSDLDQPKDFADEDDYLDGADIKFPVVKTIMYHLIKWMCEWDGNADISQNLAFRRFLGSRDAEEMNTPIVRESDAPKPANPQWKSFVLGFEGIDRRGGSPSKALLNMLVEIRNDPKYEQVIQQRKGADVLTMDVVGPNPELEDERQIKAHDSQGNEITVGVNFSLIKLTYFISFSKDICRFVDDGLSQGEILRQKQANSQNFYREVREVISKFAQRHSEGCYQGDARPWNILFSCDSAGVCNNRIIGIDAGAHKECLRADPESPFPTRYLNINNFRVATRVQMAEARQLLRAHRETSEQEQQEALDAKPKKDWEGLGQAEQAVFGGSQEKFERESAQTWWSELNKKEQSLCRESDSKNPYPVENPEKDPEESIIFRWKYSTLVRELLQKWWTGLSGEQKQTYLEEFKDEVFVLAKSIRRSYKRNSKNMYEEDDNLIKLMVQVKKMHCRTWQDRPSLSEVLKKLPEVSSVLV